MGEGVTVRSRSGRDEPFTLPPSPARGRVWCGGARLPFSLTVRDLLTK